MASKDLSKEILKKIDSLDVKDDLDQLDKNIEFLKKTVIKSLKNEQVKEEIEKQFAPFFERMETKVEKALTKIEKGFLNQRKELQKISELNENVDASLSNVLLAIKQNEYLHAWYPAQHGFPEMKVVGQHPVKIKGKK